MKFLKSLAGTFHNEHGDALSSICFVFPNRRAALFFKKYLGELSDKPIFAPKTLTIQDLFSEYTKLKQPDKIELIYKLYRVYGKYSEPATSFDDFYYWGEVLLNDFDDIDKYMIDAEKLFTNVKDLRQIDNLFSYLSENQLNAIRTFWAGVLGDLEEGSENEGSKRVENRDKFISLWEVLWPVYRDFKIALNMEGIGYEGAIHRAVIEEMQQNNESPTLPDNAVKIVFAGFNALNECERALFRILKTGADADFYWDYTGPMVKDPVNRASSFMVRNKSEFPSKYKINIDEDNLPVIEVVGVPSGSAQAAVAGEIAAELCKSSPDLSSNAIVLPDETLLMPLLYSIPQEIPEINVTMGLPLRGTAVASLMEGLADFRNGDFYHKRVLNILRNGFIQALEPESCREAIKRITEGNHIYVPAEILEGNRLFELLFKRGDRSDSNRQDDITDICDFLSDVAAYLLASESVSKSEKEFLYNYNAALIRLKNLGIPMKFHTFTRVLKSVTSGISVPFRGEPLAGLQVMGILETRALDFDNIIFCSMNEGVYPVRSSPNSFIPYNLRAGFGLPAYEFQDSVLAYNFYRSICRAKRVWLIYDTRTEGFRSGEPSRYINQLKYQYRRELEGFTLRESIRTYSVSSVEREAIVVEKSGEVMEKLLTKYFSGGTDSFSATSLNTYIDCPLSFYFKYIKELKEEDEVEESMEAGTFGTIFHESVNRIYEQFRGREVDSQALNILSQSSNIEQIASSVFKEVIKGGEIKGYNRIVLELIIKYLREVLKFDAVRAPFVYQFAEDSFRHGFKTSGGLDFKIYAKIDRIDIIEGGSRNLIIDYKTGKGGRFDEEIDYYFQHGRGDKSNIMFQMLLYALLYGKGSNGLDCSVAPYILRDIVKGLFTVREVESSDMEKFEERLVELVDEIVNPDIPFIQAERTDKSDPCVNCSFAKICKRTPNGKSF